MIKFYAVAALVIFPLLLYSQTERGESIRPLPLPEARVGPNGEGAQGSLWLGWNEAQRLGYTQGFLQGYRFGHERACLGSVHLASRFPIPKCLSLGPDFDLGAEEYSKLITAFYERYPEDRALPIRILIVRLASRAELQSIHNWLDELIKHGSLKHSQKRP